MREPQRVERTAIRTTLFLCPDITLKTQKMEMNKFAITLLISLVMSVVNTQAIHTK